MWLLNRQWYGSFFYPGGQLVAAYIPSWLQGPTAAISRRPNRILARKLVKRRNVAAIQNHVWWEGLKEVQNATILTLSLEDKALKGCAVMQGFSIFAVICLSGII